MLAIIILILSILIIYVCIDIIKEFVELEKETSKSRGKLRGSRITCIRFKSKLCKHCGKCTTKIERKNKR